MKNEASLIRAIQKKQSRKAADVLVRTYYREIYVYLFRQTGNKEDAMDLTQESFIAALQSIDRFDDAKGSFRTWLYRVATNKLIDHRRKNAVQMLPLEEDIVQEKSDDLSQLADAQLLRQIEAYVSGFDEMTQMIFRLHIYEDFSFREIAEIAEMPEASVKSKYYRLQKRIREEFGHEWR